MSSLLAFDITDVATESWLILLAATLLRSGGGLLPDLLPESILKSVEEPFGGAKPRSGGGLGR